MTEQTSMHNTDFTNSNLSNGCQCSGCGTSAENIYNFQLCCPGEYRIYLCTDCDSTKEGGECDGQEISCPEVISPGESIEDLNPIENILSGQQGYAKAMTESSENQLIVAGHFVPESQTKTQGWVVKFSKDYSLAKQVMFPEVSDFRACGRISDNLNFIAGLNTVALIDNDLNVEKSVTLSRFDKISSAGFGNGFIYCSEHASSKIIKISEDLEESESIEVSGVMVREVRVLPGGNILVSGTNISNSLLMLFSSQLSPIKAISLPAAANRILVEDDGTILTTLINSGQLLKFSDELDFQAGIDIGVRDYKNIAANDGEYYLNVSSSAGKGHLTLKLNYEFELQSVTETNRIAGKNINVMTNSSGAMENGDIVSLGYLDDIHQPLILVNSHSIIDSSELWTVEDIASPLKILPYTYVPMDIPLSLKSGPGPVRLTEIQLNPVYS